MTACCCVEHRSECARCQLAVRVSVCLLCTGRCARFQRIGLSQHASSFGRDLRAPLVAPLTRTQLLCAAGPGSRTIVLPWPASQVIEPIDCQDLRFRNECEALNDLVVREGLAETGVRGRTRRSREGCSSPNPPSQRNCKVSQPLCAHRQCRICVLNRNHSRDGIACSDAKNEYDQE